MLNPLELTSVDYSIIKHNFYNHLHILGIDLVSNYIYDLRIYENQSTNDVLKISKNIKIIHSDNGIEFTSKAMYGLLYWK